MTTISVEDRQWNPDQTTRALGYPARLARALLKIVDDPNPPQRMPFGSDTIATIEAKNAFVAKELNNLRTLAMSTDFAK